MIRRPPRSTLFPSRRSSDLTKASSTGVAHTPSRDVVVIRLRATSSRDAVAARSLTDRKSTRLNSSHLVISYAVFCLKKKTIEGERSKSSHELNSDDIMSQVR